MTVCAGRCHSKLVAIITVLILVGGAPLWNSWVAFGWCQNVHGYGLGCGLECNRTTSVATRVNACNLCRSSYHSPYCRGWDSTRVSSSVVRACQTVTFTSAVHCVGTRYRSIARLYPGPYTCKYFCWIERSLWVVTNYGGDQPPYM